MTIKTAKLLGACALALLLPATAYADGRYDVEHARANARAGGPVSEYDYELLERYGHLSEIEPRYRKPARYYKKRRYVGGDRWRH
jgi:hypothetical protein